MTPLSSRWDFVLRRARPTTKVVGYVLSSLRDSSEDVSVLGFRLASRSRVPAGRKCIAHSFSCGFVRFNVRVPGGTKEACSRPIPFGRVLMVALSLVATATLAGSLESRIDGLIASGHTAEAIPLVQQLVAQRAAQPDKLAHAQALQVLGSIASADIAWPSLQQALELFRQAHADDATLGAVEDAAALAAQKLHRYDDAERLFLAAITHRQHGELEPWLNTSRAQLAKVLLIQGRYEACAAQLALAVPAALKPDASVGLTDGMVAQRLQVLAHYHQATGSYTEAIAVLKRALALSDEPAVHNDLGMALFRLGKHEQAKAQFESARSAYAVMKPVPTEALAMCLNNLATLHLAIHDGPGALAYLDQLPSDDLPRLVNQATAQHLSGALDAAQMTVTTALERLRKELTPHHPLLVQGLTNAAALAADQHRDDDAKQLAREASNMARAWFEDVRAHADERQLLAMRRTFDPISPLIAFASDDPQTIADTVLAMKGVVLREALALKHPRSIKANVAPPDDAVFIDYLLHSAYLGKGKWEPRYGALIVLPHEAPQWLPLGEAEALNRQVRSVLDAMETSVTAGKPSRALAVQLQALWARLLPDSVRSLIGDRRLIIRPDGLLHFVPWSVLMDPQSSKTAPRFLCQVFPRVEFTAFASDIEPMPSKPTTWSVLTVPDKPMRDAPKVPPAHERLARELATMPALLGTRVEAEAIAQTGPVTLKQAATKSDLLKALESHPSILHLACHAFALNNEDESLLTRSGLVLADAAPSGAGILFAHEAAALPLHETNLVLLSACHTALGEADAGGDLTGLRHALLSAGARHVISALWSVDDTAAPAFMAALYAHLAKNESPSEALWKTQSEMLTQSPEALKTASQCGAWNLESAGWRR